MRPGAIVRLIDVGDPADYGTVRAAGPDGLLIRWADGTESVTGPREVIQLGRMTMPNTVTDKTAEQVAHTIGVLYGGHQDDMPRVFPGSHEELSDDARVIVWESGTPPESWPIAFTNPDGAAAELARRFGVWFEPVHGCALAVFPAEREDREL